MATNPMQKKARNAFLLGVVIMLVISIVIGALLFLLLFKGKGQMEEGEKTAYAYKLTQDVKAGQEITQEMVVSVETTTKVTPEDWIMSKTADKKDVLLEPGRKAKIGLTAGTLLSNSMLYGDEDIADDLRLVEFNMITLPITLTAGDYIDVRFSMPSGQDFIVVSKKEIMHVSENTIGLCLSEDEILMMNCAIVENYQILASYMYATLYVDSWLQADASPTYPLNDDVIRLINEDPNIVSDAFEAIKERTAYLNVLRRDIINPELERDPEGARQNLEGLIVQQQEKARDAREKYLSGLSEY